MGAATEPVPAELALKALEHSVYAGEGGAPNLRFQGTSMQRKIHQYPITTLIVLCYSRQGKTKDNEACQNPGTARLGKDQALRPA